MTSDSGPDVAALKVRPWRWETSAPPRSKLSAMWCWYGADREPPPQELGGKEVDSPRVNLAQPLMDQRAVEQH